MRADAADPAGERASLIAAAVFTACPHETEVWRRARQDYLGGDTAQVVCERYGLARATFYRVATRDGWRRTDVGAPAMDEPPPWALPRALRAVDIIEEHPEYAEIEAARTSEAFALLFNPEADDLRGFAFRRACEAAALHKPGEASAWLRVQRLAEQCRKLPEIPHGPYRPEDHLRAQFIRAMDPQHALDVASPDRADETE